jgi:hypothetical protein
MALRGGAGFEEIEGGFVRKRVGQWVVVALVVYGMWERVRIAFQTGGESHLGNLTNMRRCERVFSEAGERADRIHCLGEEELTLGSCTEIGSRAGPVLVIAR